MLRCRGDEDRATQGSRRQAFARAINAGRDVIVDLTELGFGDSSLMLDLAVLARRLRAHGSTLRLHNPQPPVKTVIEVMGLHRLPGVTVEGSAPALSY